MNISGDMCILADMADPSLASVEKYFLIYVMVITRRTHLGRLKSDLDQNLVQLAGYVETCSNMAGYVETCSNMAGYVETCSNGTAMC